MGRPISVGSLVMVCSALISLGFFFFFFCSSFSASFFCFHTTFLRLLFFFFFITLFSLFLTGVLCFSVVFSHFYFFLRKTLLSLFLSSFYFVSLVFFVSLSVFIGFSFFILPVFGFVSVLCSLFCTLHGPAQRGALQAPGAPTGACNAV